MEKCLGDVSFETVLVYLDDIIIFSKTFQENIKHLDQVLVKNTKHTRGSKVEPKCELTPYWVVGQPLKPTPVNDLVLEGPDTTNKWLHRNIMRPCVVGAGCSRKPADDQEAFDDMDLPLVPEALTGWFLTTDCTDLSGDSTLGPG